jgi:hypothetical protein
VHTGDCIFDGTSNLAFYGIMSDRLVFVDGTGLQDVSVEPDHLVDSAATRHRHAFLKPRSRLLGVNFHGYPINNNGDDSDRYKSENLFSDLTVEYDHGQEYAKFAAGMSVVPNQWRDT